MDFLEPDEDTKEIENIISKRLSLGSGSPNGNGTNQSKLNTKLEAKSVKNKKQKRRPRTKEFSSRIESKALEDKKISKELTRKRALETAILQKQPTSKHKNCVQTLPSSKRASNDYINPTGPERLRNPRNIRKLSRNDSSKSQKDGNDEEKMKSIETYVDKHRREVGQYGAQGLHKHDKQKFRQAELLKLGCRKPKSQKMPIATLIRKRQIQKFRDTKKKEMDLATGMLVRSRR